MRSIEVPDLKKLEMMILSIFYRMRHQGRDRRSDATVKVHPLTGLPLYEADLLPKHRAKVGESLALDFMPDPRGLAEVFLGLDYKKKADWTDEEVHGVAAFTSQIKRCVKRMAEHGWFVEAPVEGVLEGAPRLGDDGYTYAFKITPRGLEAAERKCRGTRWARGPVSALEDAPEALADAPDWAVRQWKAEGKA